MKHLVTSYINIPEVETGAFIKYGGTLLAVVGDISTTVAVNERWQNNLMTE